MRSTLLADHAKCTTYKQNIRQDPKMKDDQTPETLQQILHKKHPQSTAIPTIIEASQTQKITLEATIGSYWSSYHKAVAHGYNLIAYTGQGNNKKKLATKDWDDDNTTNGISQETLAGFIAIRECIKKIKEIANATNTPSIRIYTETTWQSAVIKPQKGYRLNLPKRYHRTTYAIKNELEKIQVYPDKVFSRGARRTERTSTEYNSYKQRFNALRQRLRYLIDPHGDQDEKLWVNLVEIRKLIDHCEGKRSSLLPALFHHLRDERRIPLKVLQEKTGVPVGQINRSANTFRNRITDSNLT